MSIAENPSSSEGERRILAILFSDIKGYSKLMGENEEKALHMLKEHNEIVMPRVEKGGGQVLKTIGDAVLASFGSALEAVTTAMRIQDALYQRNQAYNEEDRILVRIGIHVGDVLLKDNDVFGDGVNIAARLEPLAEPGGICVSKMVRDMLHANPQIILESIGTPDLKNIKTPLEVFKVGTKATPVKKSPGAAGFIPSFNGKLSPKLIQATVACLIGIAFAAGAIKYKKTQKLLQEQAQLEELRKAGFETREQKEHYERYLKDFQIDQNLMEAQLQEMMAGRSLKEMVDYLKAEDEAFREGFASVEEMDTFDDMMDELHELSKLKLGPIRWRVRSRKILNKYPDLSRELKQEALDSF